MGPDTPIVYLAVALRNAGNGIAVLHGWRFFPDWHRDQDVGQLIRQPVRQPGPDPGAGLAGHGQPSLEHRPSRPEMTL